MNNSSSLHSHALPIATDINGEASPRRSRRPSPDTTEKPPVPAVSETSTHHSLIGENEVPSPAQLLKGEFKLWDVHVLGWFLLIQGVYSRSIHKSSSGFHPQHNTSQLQTITSQAIFQSMSLRLPDVENLLFGEIPTSISNSSELAIIEFSSKLFRGIVPTISDDD